MAVVVVVVVAVAVELALLVPRPLLVVAVVVHVRLAGEARVARPWQRHPLLPGPWTPSWKATLGPGSVCHCPQHMCACVRVCVCASALGVVKRTRVCVAMVGWSSSGMPPRLALAPGHHAFVDNEAP